VISIDHYTLKRNETPERARIEEIIAFSDLTATLEGQRRWDGKSPMELWKGERLIAAWEQEPA
jgi:hypothetical protein